MRHFSLRNPFFPHWFFIMALFPLVQGFSQVKIGTPPSQPHPSATLELESTTGGFLPPRLTQTERDAIVAPAVGLIIYNTTSNCMQSYMPLGWRDMSCNCTSFPSAAFTIGSTNQVNLAVNFTATQPGLTYAWTFGSGTPATATGATASSTWSVAGTYTVTLTTTDSQGCSATTSQQVTIVNCPPPFGNTQTFSFTGSVQTFVVPASCASTIRMELWGAQGATTGSSAGGQGGYVRGDVSVTPGETLYVYVGGQNGYNGGGTAGSGSSGSNSAGNGGGGTDVRRGAQTLSDRIAVAGGGGGAGRASCANQTGGAGGFPGGLGGLGGNTLLGGNGGTNGGDVAGGGGGSNCTSSARGGAGGGQNGGGGAGGYGTAAGGTNGNCGATNSDPFGGGGITAPNGGGCFGIGGSGGATSNGGGGGGGGGWYGGGGGGGNWASGGGGGSSYTGTMTNVTTQNGVRTGNGQVIFTW